MAQNNSILRVCYGGNLKKKILGLEIVSLVFCLVFSCFNHFLYQWSGEFFLFAPFVPISESVWEHGKLLVMPFLFFSVIEWILLVKVGKNESINFNKDIFFTCYVNAKAFSINIASPVMIALYYAFVGATGMHSMVYDILLALGIVCVMGVCSYKNLTKNTIEKLKLLRLVFASVTIMLFFLITYIQPSFPLFIKP